MKFLKFVSLGLLIVIVGIQVVPTSLNQSEVVPATDFMTVNQVPKRIQRKIQISCYDCHSNNTQYPWYNKIQPVAWILEDHVKEGKEELNFNEWDTYSSRKKRSKVKSIINQIEDGEMPLPSYTWVHKNAVLNKEEKDMIIQWFETLEDSLRSR